MRTYTTEHTVYTFDELSDTAKARALESMYGINVDYNWWYFTYEDAKNIGMKITEFDIDRGNYLKARYTECPLDICRLILKDHGKETETYRLALSYIKNREALSKTEVTRLCQEEADQLCECFYYIRGAFDVEQDYFDESVTKDIDEDFHKELEDEYLAMLKRAYEHLTSNEGIIETIKANGYEFTEDGYLA
jgi:hypothetical protein